MAEKLKVVYWKCTGEAHDPKVAGNIDHCMCCAPYWEFVPECPKCGGKVKTTHKIGYNYYCRRCKLYLVENGEGLQQLKNGSDKDQ